MPILVVRVVGQSKKRSEGALVGPGVAGQGISSVVGELINGHLSSCRGNTQLLLEVFFGLFLGMLSNSISLSQWDLGLTPLPGG